MALLRQGVQHRLVDIVAGHDAQGLDPGQAVFLGHAREEGTALARDVRQVAAVEPNAHSLNARVGQGQSDREEVQDAALSAEGG